MLRICEFRGMARQLHGRAVARAGQAGLTKHSVTVEWISARRGMCDRDGARTSRIQDVIMAAAIWDPVTWAEQNFATCKLRNRARNRRLIKIARQMVRRSESSLPDQMETWAACRRDLQARL